MKLLEQKTATIYLALIVVLAVFGGYLQGKLNSTIAGISLTIGLTAGAVSFIIIIIDSIYKHNK